ncbi:MAG: lasso peptide biosynthesis B2 protein [Nitrospirota bacterium]
MYSFFLTIQVAFLIGQVWLIRRNLGRKPLVLPAVDAERTIDNASISVIVRRVDRLLSALLHKNSHHCFYRSVILAKLLRRNGVPLVVNIGGRSLSSPSMKAHSWLTLDDKPFHEQPNSLSIYPFDMGYNADRSIRYWIGPEFDDSVLKNDNITRGSAARPAGTPVIP